MSGVSRHVRYHGALWCGSSCQLQERAIRTWCVLRPRQASKQPRPAPERSSASTPHPPHHMIRRSGDDQRAVDATARSHSAVINISQECAVGRVHSSGLVCKFCQVTSSSASRAPRGPIKGLMGPDASLPVSPCLSRPPGRAMGAERCIGAEANAPRLRSGISLHESRVGLPSLAVPCDPYQLTSLPPGLP